MNTPLSIGFPQVILFLVIVIAIGLLISSVMSLRSYRIEKYEDEDGVLRRRRRRHFRWGHGFSGLVLIIVAILLLWVASLVQTYLGLTSDIQVARIHASAITNIPHLMSVELTLYDSNEHQTSTNTYVVNGDEWMLQGDVVKFPAWLNIVGLHSGYKLTRLEGRFDDPNLESNSKHAVIVLNGGDDNFFKTVQQQAWTSPFVEAAYGSGTFVQPDGKTYNVFVSQSGLYTKPDKQ